MTQTEIKELAFQVQLEIAGIEDEITENLSEIDVSKTAIKQLTEELKNRKGYLNELITEYKRNEENAPVEV